jgi:two-component system response regulator DesR
VVADDHAGFRKALVTTLGLVNGVEVIAEASDGASAAATAIEMQPDVVLMDLSMPGLSGIEAMVRIHRRRPEIPVIILTAHAEPGIEKEAMASGAQAFLAKGGSLQEMIDALLDVQLDRPAEDLGGA